MRLFFTFIISFTLIFTPGVFAGVVSEVCNNTGEQSYFPIGDERGVSVVTKKEVSRDCNLTIETQGACIKWEEKTSNINLDDNNYDSFRSSNYQDTIGSIFAVMSAYDQLDHLWSGWHGYCEKGVKTDFSWASDPFFWASIAASVIMQGSASSTTEKVTGTIDMGETTIKETEMVTNNGFLVNTSLGNSYNNFAGSIESGWNSVFASAGMSMTKGFGTCVAASGMDMMSSLFSSLSAKSADKDCDPIDEFCEGSTSTNSQDGDVFTIDSTQYADLVAAHPEYADYIVILKQENGIYTCRYKNVSEMSNYDQMSQDELNAAKEKIQNMVFMVTAAISVGKLALCGLSGGSISGSSSMGSTNQNSLFSVKNGLGMAINAIPAEWLGPYGVLIKAALVIVLEFIYSFNKIDTCNNADDATEAGNRHKKTQESLPYNLCKQTDKKCVEKKFLGSGCGLTGYDYCCYDQILTKILVEQFKAQLGRDWAHCTGITLRDLNYISFRQCTAYDKTFGVDGTTVVLNYNVEGKLTNPYDPTTSYQYQRKCIDLTEYKEYMKATINTNIDFTDFDSVFDDLSGQIK